MIDLQLTVSKKKLVLLEQKLKNMAIKNNLGEIKHKGHHTYINGVLDCFNLIKSLVKK